MADNKAKRPFSLAQANRRSPNPNPQSSATEPQPVKTFTYRAIAELNAGFEKVRQDIKALQGVGYLNTERLAALGDLIGRLRAETNQDLIAALHRRELANQSYFERLCQQWDKPTAS